MIEVLLVSALLVFRAVGALGVRRFRTWPASAAHALAVMLLVTASAHFVPAAVTAMPNHGDLVAMVPPIVPFPDAVVYLTGVLELLGAAGLVVVATRWSAAVGLTALFVLLLPANVYAALADVPFQGHAPTPLGLRVAEQVLYLAVAVWVARSADPAPARRVLHVLHPRRPQATPEPATGRS
ncbi:Uncharacterized membrane protein [Actinopolymorpha cephalotaxi]|uniref:Uncharacterized membrane protein n=1 Tax=Actinopolymorpha cephalotaxi TaxID=504797 RepID=A0A1I2MWR6_9ACTN|nr:hypothetical protein [Actinopolymorpha cephalotaxi]SFF95883.1 Uncharacterized membrane protein [Actinopolymorpha cephalotaxi]